MEMNHMGNSPKPSADKHTSPVNPTADRHFADINGSNIKNPTTEKEENIMKNNQSASQSAQSNQSTKPQTESVTLQLYNFYHATRLTDKLVPMVMPNILRRYEIGIMDSKLTDGKWVSTNHVSAGHGISKELAASVRLEMMHITSMLKDVFPTLEAMKQYGMEHAVESDRVGSYLAVLEGVFAIYRLHMIPTEGSCVNIITRAWTKDEPVTDEEFEEEYGMTWAEYLASQEEDEEDDGEGIEDAETAGETAGETNERAECSECTECSECAWLDEDDDEDDECEGVIDLVNELKPLRLPMPLTRDASASLFGELRGENWTFGLQASKLSDANDLVMMLVFMDSMKNSFPIDIALRTYVAQKTGGNDMRTFVGDLILKDAYYNVMIHPSRDYISFEVNRFDHKYMEEYVKQLTKEASTAASIDTASTTETFLS